MSIEVGLGYSAVAIRLSTETVKALSAEPGWYYSIGFCYAVRDRI